MFVDYVTRNPKFFNLKYLIFNSKKIYIYILKTKLRNLRFFEKFLIFYLIRKIILKIFSKINFCNKKIFDYFFKNSCKINYGNNGSGHKYFLNYQKSKIDFQKLISRSKCIIYLKQKKRNKLNKFYPILQFDSKQKKLNLSKIKKIEIKTIKPKNYSLNFKII